MVSQPIDVAEVTFEATRSLVLVERSFKPVRKHASISAGDIPALFINDTIDSIRLSISSRGMEFELFMIAIFL